MRRIFGKKTVVDGITFDSEIEAKYYEYLKSRGERIKSLEIHKTFTLQERFRDKNKNIYKEITYSPDFIYYDEEDNKYHFVDVKGYLDDKSALVWKLFVKHILDKDLCIYNDAVFSIVKYSKTTGFVDLKDYKKAMAKAKAKAIQEKNEAVKEKEQMEKDLKTIKKLRDKATPLTKLQTEKLTELEEKYKEFI
jgi:hypothetical protein